VNKIIATFPCSDAPALIEFYKHLGFELTGQYTRSYLVFKYEDLELHFYGSKMYQPHENPTMCIILTENLEQLYTAFTEGIKAETGKIPRNGFPKISKLRDLNEDRRFTLADPSGNTIYVIEQIGRASCRERVFQPV
jgi:catechol 2,3-dioxygenase-like lactoylglutathione lyase family enzyme